MSRSAWDPRWSYNDRIARSLMDIAMASAAVDAGFLVVQDTSNRGRRYGLSEDYRKYIGRLSEAALRRDPGGA